jgi:prepilin signal peptidase PulO-like enzyme (type II secretory pathway)
MLQLICLKFLILYNGISRIVVILCKIHKVIVINILFPQHRLTIIDKHSDRTGIVKLIEHYLESLPWQINVRKIAIQIPIKYFVTVLITFILIYVKLLIVDELIFSFAHYIFDSLSLSLSCTDIDTQLKQIVYCRSQLTKKGIQTHNQLNSTDFVP